MLVAVGDGDSQLVGAHNRLPQNIAAQRMEAAGGSIHHHQPLSGKRVGDELRKRLPQTSAFPITSGELIEHRARAEDRARLS